MKANLPQREPDMLKHWKEQDLYDRIMKKSQKAKRKYILHDGPPYSNGDIHMGHVLNKILKDIVVKFNTMIGHNVPFVPGWDCHGLPVEHQLMKNLNIEKGDISQAEFRSKARDFALKYVNIQRSQFERLGIFGDWHNPYLTLDTKYEGAIVKSFAKLVGSGYIYKDLKPVNWCYKCETALAEAEVEYEMHTSPSIFVKFKLTDLDGLKKVLGQSIVSGIKGEAFVLIWTTTPWTLVANVAIALSPSMKYVIVESKGSYLILAEELLNRVAVKLGIEEINIIASIYGKKLEGMECLHPFVDRKSKIVLGDYVSQEEGTGCVHTAPGHGQEDYLTGRKYNLPTIMPVDSKGRFDETSGEFKNMHVFEANKRIAEKLKKLNSLMHIANVEHSYPHCWRCKSPIISRATSQYFMNVDHEKLRSRVNKAVSTAVKWVPETGKERISTMVGNRPDWCLSRQRLWGVPIVSFYCSKCDELLLDRNVINHVAGLFEKEGSDIWFTKEASELLPEGTRCAKCKSGKFKKESDILDVWFESGVSHQAVLKPRKEYPADLYLEGSDQHRGWFQSAILSSMAIDGIAPYRTVLTHGFVVDGEGKKMSKSVGNVISPEDVMKKYGEAYRKIRNTCRFIIGNLYDFDSAEDAVIIDKWSEIDKWALSRARRLLESSEMNFQNFAFHKVFTSIYNFCVVDMSSIYLDVLKDTLYTYGKESVVRRSAQSALFEIICILTKIMAPILAYSAEEVWKTLPGIDSNASIHTGDWPDAKRLKARISRFFGEKDEKRWNEKLLPLRGIVLKKLEESRSKNMIGSSLDAKILLYSKNKEWQRVFDEYGNMLNSLFIVSSVEIAQHVPTNGSPAEDIPVNIKVEKAEGKKCQRCWNYSPSVGSDNAHPTLCERCRKVIETIQ
jgi:isoleucyl-tRNA synthetase